MTSASGAIVPLAEMNEIRASAAVSATAQVQAVEKPATSGKSKETATGWFQTLLEGSATISSSSNRTSTSAAVTPSAITPSTRTSPSPLSSSHSVPNASPVTSELTLTPVPSPS